MFKFLPDIKYYLYVYEKHVKMTKKILIVIAIISILFWASKPNVNDFMSFAPSVVGVDYNTIKNHFAVAKERDYFFYAIYSIKLKGKHVESKDYFVGVLGNFYEL